MIRQILTYPNPILRKKSLEVTKFDKTLHQLLDDMHETMVDKGGVGLASVQIGVLKQVLIINIPDEDDMQYEENLIEAINPKIISMSGDFVFKEGCLSVPDFHEEITRYRYVKIEYYDRFGKKQISNASEFLAVAWQHEIEHLKGRIFIEKLSFLKRKKFEKEYKKAIKKRKTK